MVVQFEFKDLFNKGLDSTLNSIKEEYTEYTTIPWNGTKVVTKL